MSLDWLKDSLAALEREGILRIPGPAIAEPGPRVVREGRSLLNLCSNDYLSLAGASVASSAGAGASRLIAGDLVAHRELETDLAAWLGVEAVLVFASGYAANVGAIAALCGPEDLIVSDALNHASIIDGCRLSRARVVVVPHRDVAAFESALATPGRRKLLVTDGYFSMDGTRAPVAELAAAARRHGATFYVDDAHGFGVWGAEGRGVCAEEDLRPDVWMGTLGKSFGASGAFVAGSRALISWLWNRARSFVFSTGLPPASAVAARTALPLVRASGLRSKLHENVRVLRDAIGRAAAGVGPIIPIGVGDPQRTVALSRSLLEQGFFVQAIRPPTVPRGTSRLRVTVQAGHQPAELAEAGARIRRALA